MSYEMYGFIQKDHFDLNSYLTYLFNKFNETTFVEEKEKLIAIAEEKKSDCN